MAKKKLRGGILNDKNTFISVYLDSLHKKALFFIVLTIVSLGTVLLTLGFGVYHISIVDAIQTFMNHIIGNITDSKNDYYVWDVRLPRALGALFVGVGLSIGGVIMQNNMRNPLAEPYTMGISSGAFLGAILSMVCGISIIPFLSGETSTIANAFLFSLIPTTIIVLISKFKKLTSTSMILLGIATMFVFSSICQLILVTAPSETLADAYNWKVGTLAKITWNNLPMIIIPVTGISLILFSMEKKLDVMYSGDRTAQTLGVNANRLRLFSLVLVSFMTAAIVSFTGTIGFIGLVGPHIARIFVGSSNKYLIPSAAAFGATFIILADTLAKISGANGLPVGVISAMIGGPLFIYILIRQKKSAW